VPRGSTPARGWFAIIATNNRGGSFASSRGYRRRAARRFPTCDPRAPRTGRHHRFEERAESASVKENARKTRVTSLSGMPGAGRRKPRGRAAAVRGAATAPNRRDGPLGRRMTDGVLDEVVRDHLVAGRSGGRLSRRKSRGHGLDVEVAHRSRAAAIRGSACSIHRPGLTKKVAVEWEAFPDLEGEKEVRE